MAFRVRLLIDCRPEIFFGKTDAFRPCWERWCTGHDHFGKFGNVMGMQAVKFLMGSHFDARLFHGYFDF